MTKNNRILEYCADVMFTLQNDAIRIRNMYIRQKHENVILDGMSFAYCEVCDKLYDQAVANLELNEKVLNLDNFPIEKTLTATTHITLQKKLK